MAQTHYLKCWPETFQPIFSGDRYFDLRKNDRKFAVGDTVVFQEWDTNKGKHTGLEIRRKISHILEGVGSGGIAPTHGLMRGYCIISLCSPA